MRYTFRSFILVLLLLASVGGTAEVWAQEAKHREGPPVSFGVSGYYGALFRYRSGVDALTFSHPVAVEVYATRHSLGKRQWERKYKYPQLGAALSYYNYGVPDELGEALSLTGYMDNSLVKFRKSSLRFNLGAGLVYATRHYIPGKNELNMAVGSTVGFALRGTLRYETPLTEHVHLNLNLAFRHFSNGALNKPNNGMNFPLVGVGLRYQPQKSVEPDGVATDGNTFSKRIRFNLRAAAGVKEVLYIDEKHWVHSLSLYASKQLTQTNSILLGADGFRNTSFPQEYMKIGAPIPEGKLDERLAGVTVGHELHISKLAVVFQLGRYIYQPHGFYPDYYQRYGLRYSLTEHVSANVLLVAHTRTANVIEWGLGLHL